MGNRAVLLVNLGSPDSASVRDVRRYLREFLMDGRVLDAPWPVRFCIVHFGILPKRPVESAHAYSAIWTAEGSPLIVTSRRVRAALQERLSVPVELAMRYQNPSIDHAVRSLARQGIEEMLLIPLFPHYAMSSYESAVVRVREVVRHVAPAMNVEVMPPYVDHPDYIRALVASARDALGAPHDHVLFSFHGIPERHLRKSDPTGAHCLASPQCCEVPSPAHATCYRAQCFATVRRFVDEARLSPGTYSVAFQSRLGKDPWLRPYTDEQLTRFPSAGVRRLVVLCPAFVSDCLETLEEIGLRGRDSFLRAGGTSLTLVPCLNEHPRWLDALEGMVTTRWADVARPTASSTPRFA
jgi:protoporphyrin/coproporphyrin ferrochelatase